MKWSYSIGRVAGTDIKVHLTFVALLALYAASAYQVGGTRGAIDSTVFLLALFGCVLLHEFGHIGMARRFGVRTPDVILLPIGGVARLERIPEEPIQEFLIAIAGPAVTLAIAAGLYAYLSLTGVAPRLLAIDLQADGFLAAIMGVNVYLLLFNLIPAFPMDGGRVLRATLASRLGLLRATRIAATVGQAVAIGFGFWGLGFLSVWGLHANFFLLLIAFFVFVGAGAEANAVETRTASRGILVQHMMVTRFQTLPVWASLQHAVDVLLEGEQREFPVVDNEGKVEGLLTRENLIKGLADRGPGSAVGQAMTPGVPAVVPTMTFEDAVQRLRASGVPALPVVDPAAGLVGLLTLDNISDMLMVRKAGGIA